MAVKRWRILAYAVSLILVIGICPSLSGAAGDTDHLTWVPTGTKGTTYGVAVAAASLINKYSPLAGFPKLRISVVPGKGTVVHTRQLIEGEINIGLSNPTSAGAAYSGTGKWAEFGDKGKRLRVLLPATVMAAQIYSLWDGSVKTFDDIKGKRLAEMSKAMGMQKVNAAIWEAAGWNPDKDMKTTYYSTLSAQLDALRDGHADVVIQTQGYPSSGPTELFTVRHCRVISMPEDVAKRAAEKSQSWFPVTMPANTYPKQDYPVSSVGLVLFWAVTTEMPDNVAYEICKIMHDHQKEGAEMWGPFGQFAPDLFVNFGVPLHPGAAKYWKEIGWIK